MKKILSIIVASGFVLIGVAGCSSAEPDPDGYTPPRAKSVPSVSDFTYKANGNTYFCIWATGSTSYKAGGLWCENITNVEETENR